MGKEKHPIINNCLGTVFGTLIVMVILALIPIVRNFFLSLFRNIIQFLINSSQLPNYIIFLLSILSLLLIIIIFIKIINRIRKKDPNEAKSYTEDTILGMKWRWSRIVNKFPSSDLWCFCPQCNYRLVYHYDYDYQIEQSKTIFNCEHCGFTSETLPGNIDAVKDRISREVERKINTGEVF